MSTLYLLSEVWAQLYVENREKGSFSGNHALHIGLSDTFEL